MKQQRQDYPDDVRVILPPLPAQRHDKALQAPKGRSSQPAGQILGNARCPVRNQDEWALMTPTISTLTAGAAEAWTGYGAFEAITHRRDCREDHHRPRNAALITASRHAVHVGQWADLLPAPRDYSSLSGILNLFKLEDRQYRPPPTVSTLARITPPRCTPKGDVVIQHYDDVARSRSTACVLAQDGCSTTPFTA
jgi:hypothetical protein